MQEKTSTLREYTMHKCMCIFEPLLFDFVRNLRPIPGERRAARFYQRVTDEVTYYRLASRDFYFEILGSDVCTEKDTRRTRNINSLRLTTGYKSSTGLSQI